MTSNLPFRRIVAIPKAGLKAVLGAPRELRYDRLPPAGSDVPGFVRAASAIRRVGSRLIVVQDDVNALASIDASGRTGVDLLPRGAHGARTFGDLRGNKRAKMDLEAAVTLPGGRLLALGSGSSRTREHVVLFEPGCAARVRRAPGLYARLRRLCKAAGQELNIEGAVLQGEHLRLMQRGNGTRDVRAARGSLVFDIELRDLHRWLDAGGRVPAIVDVLEVDLGASGRVGFGFTDAACVGDDRIAFLASAEDSPDATLDGPVAGCRFGWLYGDRAETTDVVDAEGARVQLKLEGIEPRPDETGVFDVVADLDREDRPALIAELQVTG